MRSTADAFITTGMKDAGAARSWLLLPPPPLPPPPPPPLLLLLLLLLLLPSAAVFCHIYRCCLVSLPAGLYQL